MKKPKATTTHKVEIKPGDHCLIRNTATHRHPATLYGTLKGKYLLKMPPGHCVTITQLPTKRTFYVRGISLCCQVSFLST